MRNIRFLPVALLFLLPATSAPAAAPPGVAAPLKRALDAADAMRIGADLRFLADDLLEGRGTGQKGGQLAALYLETRFRLLGLEPGASQDSYLQEVPLIGVETQAQSRLTIAASDRSFEARWLDDYVANAETQKEAEDIDAPLVFVG